MVRLVFFTGTVLGALLLISYAGVIQAQPQPPAEEATTPPQQHNEPESTEIDAGSPESEPSSEADTSSSGTDAVPEETGTGNETDSETDTDTDTDTKTDTGNDTGTDTAAQAETEPAPRTDPEEACDRIKDLDEKESTWYDSAHAVMNTAFCEPAVWFDDFFASDRIFEEVGGTYVRWRNDFIYQQEDGFDFQTNLNFSIELPRISSKIKLIFEGDEDQSLQDVLPGGQTQSTNNTLGLRVDVKRTDRSKFNVSFSAKPRVRARYRYTYPARDDFIIRFTQELQNEKGVNGARSRLDLEKAFLPLKLLRSTTEFFAAEDFPGAEWAQAFSLFQRISRKKSVSYEASLVGITRPENLVTNYRLGFRYRQNIHRDWLFLEATPDITWPIDLSEDREEIIKERRSVYSLIVRLEVHFGNAKKRKYSDFF